MGYILYCVLVSQYKLSTILKWWQKVSGYFKVMYGSFIFGDATFPVPQSAFASLRHFYYHFFSSFCHLFRCYHKQLSSGYWVNTTIYKTMKWLPCFAVVDLVYWRNMRRTGVVFTGLVIGLASLFQLSAITVLSHICLGVMCITFPLCLYYKLLELLRWNPGVHPFQWVCRFRCNCFSTFFCALWGLKLLLLLIWTSPVLFQLSISLC